MSTVRPFKAIRPGEGYAEKIASLPYDVMNRKEAAEMAEGKPYSFLHICRSEIDLPGADEYAPEVYEKAASNIESFLEQGAFIEEEKPVYYVYREIMDGKAQTGIVATVSVDEYLDGTIKIHEFTREEKEQDRIRHFDVCNAHTEPLIVTYREEGQISSIINDWAEGHEPACDFVGDGDIRHIMWVLDDDQTIQKIEGLFEEIPALYMADGHHRSASASKVCALRRQQHPDYTGEEEFNFFMAAIFPDSELNILDYNRVVADLNGLSAEQFIESIKAAGFDVSDEGTECYRPEAKGVFGMFLEGRWYRLAAKPEIIPDDVIGSLDVAVLHNSLLEPVLAIGDIRKDSRIDFVGGIRGLKELERRATSDMKVAFAVYPVEIGDLLKVADAGEIMPPKSTWFEPKLASGLLVHRM